MFNEDEFHRKIRENLDALGRPLNPKGSDLLGGYPLSLEMKWNPECRAKCKKADFLGGDGIGLWSIDREVKRKYKDFPAVSSATFYEDGVIKGSNPFYVVAVNEILREEGRRTATPADLERLLEGNLLDLDGVFVDLALVLRSGDRPNKYLAKNLRTQIRSRFSSKLLLPVMLPLAGLKLERDQNSRHGLAFKLRDYARMRVYAPQLNHKNDRKRFSKTDEDGLPLFDENGKRTLHTRNSGLSRLYLSENNLYSDFNYLDCSGAYGAGRVVVVSRL